MQTVESQTEVVSKLSILCTVKYANIRTAKKLCHKRSETQTQRFYHGEIPFVKYADGIVNREDLDQAAPLSSLHVCTDCQDLSVRKLRIVDNGSSRNIFVLCFY